MKKYHFESNAAWDLIIYLKKDMLIPSAIFISAIWNIDVITHDDCLLIKSPLLEDSDIQAIKDYVIKITD